MLWKAHILPAVRGAQLMGYLSGPLKAPAESIQAEKSSESGIHQWVLSYLLNSMTRKVIIQVTMYQTAAEVWGAIHLLSKMSSTRKGDTTALVYFTEMRGYAEEIEAAEKKFEDDDVISYIYACLVSDYNSFIENVSTDQIQSV